MICTWVSRKLNLYFKILGIQFHKERFENWGGVKELLSPFTLSMIALTFILFG